METELLEDAGLNYPLENAKLNYPDLFKGDYTDEDIIRYHEELYNACGLEKPKVIILDSYLLCRVAAYVFSKIDQFIKEETVKYYKKNKNDKKYLLDHLFENWHNLLDGFFYNNDNVKKNSAIKALDSHVRKHIENVVLENEKHLFLKIYNFFKNHFFSLNSKKEKSETKKQFLEYDRFGAINNFFAEKHASKKYDSNSLLYDLSAKLKSHIDPYRLNKNEKRNTFYYQNKIRGYERVCKVIKNGIENGFFFSLFNENSLSFSFMSEVNRSRNILGGTLRELDEIIIIARKMALIGLLWPIDMDKLVSEGYTAFFNIFHCCLGSLQQNQYVFVLRNAEKKNQIHKNGRLHSVDDYAYKFLDGTGFYFFRGQSVEENLFKSLSEQKYTFEDFKHEKNEEIKSLVLAFYEEKFGSDFVFNFISQNLMEVDTFVYKKSEKYLEGTKKGMNIGVYTLFKDKDKNVKFAYVRCYCPSTDRMFFLGVPPHFNDAKNAIASLCEVPRELKDNLVSIRRQGEIFSFTFDDEGTKKLKEKSIDLTQTVSLTGDEYFSKMEFEY